MITNYKTKCIECDRCGRVSKVAKHIPLKFSCCPQCGALKIRLFKPSRLWLYHRKTKGEP